MNESKSGFTIVELLIVIVVIGILAAITIVAFSSVQDRARIASGISFERQIKSKYIIDAMGVWDLDDCSGATIKNEADSPSTSTITGAAIWVTDTPTGKGCALKLNGSTHIETQSKLGITYYVKSAWVRIPKGPCSTTSTNNIISQATTNGVEAALYAPSCKPSAGHNGSWTTIQSPQAINDGKWHHIAVLWEGNTLTLYVDGRNVASEDSISAPTNAATGVVSIGAYLSGHALTGDIDNLFIAAK